MFGLLPVLAVEIMAAQPVTLTPGMVITQSVRVVPRTYRLGSASLDEPVITIRGRNITVDFNGAVLMGSPNAEFPNEYEGLGVRVEGENVTIRNLKVHRFKVGLLARDVPGIRITRSDFSYNWKQRLMSGLDREDTSDWMSYHRNEDDQWLRYGAGIYLRNCPGFEVDNNVAYGGQNVLMLTDCNDGKVWNNDFSFHSSAALLMFRSSRNKIMHNKMDWCVRGYSHGVYNRGQDSAGIIIYEQSNDNLFAYNSVTHGGDGFFLWAGQTTMDTGQGGSNDNILFGNDFSHAPTNGIEATFSRNAFVNNLLLENWHGIWGGYSFDTLILGNYFGMNGEAIAIEHGQDNDIAFNIFDRDTTAVKLWWNAREDPNWGYPRYRDTTSRDYRIRDNVFRTIYEHVFDINNTKNVQIHGNTIERYKNLWRLTGNNENIEFDGNTLFHRNFNWGPLPNVRIGRNEFNTTGARAGEPGQMLMYGSGNVVQGLDPDNRDYIRRFDVPWNPWNHPVPEVQKFAPPRMAGGMDPFLKPGSIRGRRFILVDEWGPYDFKSPILWPRSEPAPNVKRFEILGPEGTWTIKNLRGVRELRSTSNRTNTYVDAVMEPGQATDVLIELEFRSRQDFVDRFGNVVRANTPFVFSWGQFRMPIDWNVRWFSWTDDIDPRTNYEGFRRMLETATPIKTERTDKLEYAWPGALGPGLPSDRFATVAEGTFTVPPGEYELEVTSDDGVRVWIDDEVVLEDWTWHAPKVDRTVVQLGGQHRIRVHHFEIDGYATLIVKLQPRRQTGVQRR